MTKSVLSIFALFVITVAYSQTSSEFNFGFETVEDGVPVDWYAGGNGYEMLADSSIKKEGVYSARIESTSENPNYAAH